MNMQRQSVHRKQKGAAALFFTVIALLLTLIVVGYTANSTLTEVRIAANDEKAKAALANAEAGISEIISELNKPDSTLDLSKVSEFSSNSGGLFYRTRACGSTTPNPNNFPACPQSPASLGSTYCAAPSSSDRNVWLVSCGWFDQNSPADARRRVITMISRTNPTGVPPNSPVTTGGLVGVGGNATVVNYFNNLTYWSAEDFSSISNTGKTAVRNPNPQAQALTGTDPDPSKAITQIANQVETEAAKGNVLCTNTSITRPIVCTTSSSSSTLGPDVVGNDQSLKRLKQNPDNFFNNFMGSPPKLYQETNAPVGTDNHIDLKTENLNPLKQSTTKPGIYWIDTNPTGTGSVAIDFDIGSAGNPVILVVNGNLEIKGSPKIHGLIYVNGEITGTGGPTVRGSIIALGDVKVTGGLTVIYDPTNLNFNRGEFINYAPTPGTWRDF